MLKLCTILKNAIRGQWSYSKIKKGNWCQETLWLFARDQYDTYVLPGGKVVKTNQTPFYSSDMMDWKEWQAYEPKRIMTDKHMFIRAICHNGVEGATASSSLL